MRHRAISPKDGVDVWFDNCLVTKVDDKGKFLDCKCSKIIWSLDAKTGTYVGTCTGK